MVISIKANSYSRRQTRHKVHQRLLFIEFFFKHPHQLKETCKVHVPQKCKKITQARIDCKHKGTSVNHLQKKIGVFPYFCAEMLQ